MWETLDLSEKLNETEDDEELLRAFVEKNVDEDVPKYQHGTDFYEQKTEEMMDHQRLLTKTGTVMKRHDVIKMKN